MSGFRSVNIPKEAFIGDKIHVTFEFFDDEIDRNPKYPVLFDIGGSTVPIDPMSSFTEGFMGATTVHKFDTNVEITTAYNAGVYNTALRVYLQSVMGVGAWATPYGGKITLKERVVPSDVEKVLKTAGIMTPAGALNWQMLILLTVVIGVLVFILMLTRRRK